MRADRLVSIIMLLQSRGKVPARELAGILGVSVRTILRDMDALSTAGIPIYTERGPEGGCCLVEDYRTDLTGLNQDEARALFLLTAPGLLDSLEVGQKMRSALRKLAAALPGYLGGTEQARPRIHLDWTAWGERPAAGESLEVLYRAVYRQQVVVLAYRLWSGIEIEQRAWPLGLVAKTGEWHLAWMAHGKLRWQRVNALQRVQPTGENFQPPPDFDLERAWQENLEVWQADRAVYRVQAGVIPTLAGELQRRVGITVLSISAEPDEEGWLHAELACASLEAARQSLLGMGRGIKIFAPEPLRLGMLDYARQILQVYEDSPALS